MQLAWLYCLAAAVGTLAQTPPSHLPSPPSGGVFNASGSILIDAPIDTVWDILANFSSYPDWNPFVRSQVIIDGFGIPLVNQTPTVGLHLFISVQIPPLSIPVSADTPPNLVHAQTSFENITYFDMGGYQMAWEQIMFPASILSAERWSVLSVFEGQTYYESQEVYTGSLASVIKPLFEQGLNEAFQSQATALKERATS